MSDTGATRADERAQRGRFEGARPQRRDDFERPLQQSVLDRLIDDDRRAGAERPLTRAESVAALKRAVRRDLEWLLNTRRETVDGEGADEVRRSALWYGLPDVSSLSRGGDAAQVLARVIEAAVTVFEPRLARVRVHAAANEREHGPAELRFTIEALLRMDPAPERVVFDTVLELGRGEYRVRGEDAGA